MDKKITIRLAVTAFSFAAGAANATTVNYAGVPTPTPEAIVVIPGTDYPQIDYTYTRSADVTVVGDLGNGGATARSAVVQTSQMKKGTRSYGASVGAVSLPPKACQTTGTTAVLQGVLSAAGYSTCTF